LDALAKKTKVLIATIGPYSLHGEHAFKACAENGTHYLDITGEVPYVAEMIRKYEKTAKLTGAIMIPQIGLDSAPADLVTWTLVEMIRNRLSVPTAEVVVSIHDIKLVSSTFTESVLIIQQCETFRWNIEQCLQPHGCFQPEAAQSSSRSLRNITNFRPKDF
jgi:short subunit dehydrogenase-like uncharacterized protein